MVLSQGYRINVASDPNRALLIFDRLSKMCGDDDGTIIMMEHHAFVIDQFRAFFRDFFI